MAVLVTSDPAGCCTGVCHRARCWGQQRKVRAWLTPLVLFFRLARFPSGLGTEQRPAGTVRDMGVDEPGSEHPTSWSRRVLLPVRDVPDIAGRVRRCAHALTRVDRFGYLSCSECCAPLQWWAGWVSRGLYGDDAATLRYLFDVDAAFTPKG